MNGRLPAWLASWLGVPVPSNADSASWQLDTRWSWAPWATLLLVLAAIAWTVGLYLRESGNASRAYRAALASLRIAAFGLLLIMLAQWALAIWLTGPPSIAIVIDNSASMGIADRYDDSAEAARLNERLAANGLTEPNRLNLAKLLLKENNEQLIRELVGRYRTSTYVAAAKVERISDASDPTELGHTVEALTSDGPASQATRIGDALVRVIDDFRGAPPAAVILLSDGAVTEGASLADAAQNLRTAGIPLLAVGIGSAKAPHDIELSDVLVDDVVYVNDVVSFQVQIKATGLEGERANVTLQRDGDSTPLATQAIVLPPPGKTLSVRLTDRPTKAGELNYVIQVAAREDETDKKNNLQTRKITVRDDKIRVLLAQGYPNYEFRFLKTLLERDQSVQLSTYLQDADPEYAEQDKTALRSFPVNRDELMTYDVVIIGDLDPRLLPQSVWQNVRAFVSEKGGGAVFIAGPKFLPGSYRDNSDVAALLPVKIDSNSGAGTSAGDMSRGFTVRPTPLGLQNPAFQLGDSPTETQQIWSRLAPLYWLYPASDMKPGAQVLADGVGKPAICFQYFGAGRVLFHAIDSTWRWRAGGGEPYFARYWVQTIRLLARGKLGKGRGVELTADRREYRRGEVAQLRARFLDASLAPPGEEVIVLVSTSGQPRKRVSLRRNSGVAGIYEGSLADLADGWYEIVIVEPQLPGSSAAVQFSVVAPPGEFAHTEMAAAALAAAAETTHGKFYTIADAERLLAELPAGRRVPIQNLPPIPIWNRWWLLGAFLSCITSEWILRKRKGML